jgi:hypothetical protein
LMLGKYFKKLSSEASEGGGGLVDQRSSISKDKLSRTSKSTNAKETRGEISFGENDNSC